MKVFLSSTLLDLKEHRQAVFHVVHSLEGYTDDMSYWPADERTAAMLSVERVRQCDAMILVLAHRYGYVPPESEYSVTELEYRAAREAAIPIYAFFVDESTPWPPNLVEWEKRKELERFKKLVASEVVHQTFASPESLATLVTQALASFRARLVQTLSSRNRFEGKAHSVVAPAYLRAKENVLIEIGEAEDGLPLLLKVQRAWEMGNPLGQLAGEHDLPSTVRHSEAFASFKKSYEDLASQVLAERRIKPVLMRDGTTRELYVTQPTLSSLFRSSLSTIMDAVWASASPATGAQASSGTSPSPTEPAPRRAWQSAAVVVATDPKQALPSVGGRNRFLGISPVEGDLYSVGWQGSKWVEWHPFLSEALTPYFSKARFVLKSAAKGPQAVEIDEYKAALAQLAFETAYQDGRIPIEVALEPSRQSIGQLILAVGRSLVEFHRHGFVHGDLKPPNVILTRRGPELTDHFSLTEGEIAPGWTPDWSAPEQVLGEPVSFKSDIYPMGRMLSDLLSGLLVGEVRKFKTPPLPDGRTEIDIFYNPSIYVGPVGSVLADEKSLRSWLALVRSCMRFKPEERPSSEDFTDRLANLLEIHPLVGVAKISMARNLLAVILPQGQETVGRVIEVAEPPLALPSGFSRLPPPPVGFQVTL